MRILNSFLLILIFLVSANCNTTSNSEEDAETIAAKAKLLEADSGFSIDLFKAIHANDSSDNIFISPLSVSMALGMTMNGATGNTHFEMQNTLGYVDMTQEEINKGYQSLKKQLESADEEVEFSVANSVWSKQDFSVKGEFTSAVQEYFDAETASLDFDDPKTLDKINDWVSEKTNERITKIIESINPLDVMYLINAVYFNGSWKYEFDPEETIQYDFFTDLESSIQIEMMNQKNVAGYHISEDVTVLELPYGNESFSMLFIKPSMANVSIDDIVELQLTKESLAEWQSNITRDSVNYYIPKLELEYKRKMIPDLQSLGMNQVFIEGAAELDNLFDVIDNIFVSNVLHKTFLKMDEEGTEAAGVTAVTVTLESLGPPQPPTIIFNQPYLLVLKEKETNAILFIGKIGNPSAE